MTKSKRKYLVCIIILMSLCIYIIPKTYAVSAPLPYVSINKSSGGTYEKPRYETDEYIIDNSAQYYCTYNDNLSLLRVVNVNAYDSKGRTIIPFFPISLVDFKAGTSIGTNVQEVKTAAWNIGGRKIYEHLYTKQVKYEYIGCPICETAAACKAAQACAALGSMGGAAACAGLPPAQAAACAGQLAANAGAALGIDISQCQAYAQAVASVNCEAAIKECQECLDGCTSEKDEYCNAFGPYNGPTGVTDKCKATGPAYTMDFKSEDEDKLSVWMECCKKTYDTCHKPGESDKLNREPSIFPLRIVEKEKELSEDKNIEKIVNMCSKLAAADTSDKRAIPFVATPTIELQIFEPNEYNKKNEDDADKIELKTFSGYKVLIDKKLNGEDKLRQTKKITHYINTYDNKYKSGEISYYLESFYNFEYGKKHIKEIDDPNQLKTNLPEVDYVPKEEDKYYVTYEYSPDKVCIDVRTSDVYYDVTDTKGGYDTETNDCSNLQSNNTKSDDIKEVENKITEDAYLNQKEVEYWHYFVPLDTTTTNSDGDDVGFFISVTDKRTSPMKSDYCISILEYLNDNQSMGLLNYADILLPIKNGTSIGFKGDYNGDKSASDYKLFSDQGYECLFSLKVKFNIKQKFYGEVTDDGKLKIKGYGFYYKPIDVNAPFPNALASDSLWNNLYSSINNNIIIKNEEGKEIKTIDLYNSFANITYTTKEISSDASIIDQIRNATTNGEKYTSFKDINIKNGQSPFISEYNLRRDVDLSTLYKLGCGPENLNWEGCK